MGVEAGANVGAARGWWTRLSLWDSHRPQNLLEAGPLLQSPCWSALATRGTLVMNQGFGVAAAVADESPPSGWPSTT